MRSLLTNQQRRSLQKREQSPGLIIEEKRSNEEQVERLGLLSNDAGDKFFVRGDDEQLHHLKGLRVFDGLFANTNKEESAILSSLLGGSGNQIINQYWTPQKAHQGRGGTVSVHNLMRDRGLDQTAASAKQHELLWEIDQATNSPFEYKCHLALRARDELIPATKEAYDDAMTAYYEPTPEAQVEARARVQKYLELTN